MRVHIRKKTNYYFPVLYVLKIIEKNQNYTFDFVSSIKQANVFWDHTNIDSQPIQLAFYDFIATKKSSNIFLEKSYDSDPGIFTKDGKKDFIATIFYMINCLQETYSKKDAVDHLGRFKYEASYQYKFSCIEENLVQKEIDHFFFKEGIKGLKKRSTFFISHDIDTLYGSFLQDGFWALKNMRIHTMLKIIANEALMNPHWKNIDKIIKINNEYDVKSTFFWLVNKGKGIQNIKNADYLIGKEKKLLNLVSQSGSFNGLHKSCSKMSINEEFKKSGLNNKYNRYHFLKFLPKNDWDKLSNSVIELDCSLGFAERYGFRNSYGKAFQPYNTEKNEPYNFIEAPLHFMDTTFHKYMNVPKNKISEIVIDFFEKNTFNCNFSLLWHNTYFTEYKYNNFLKEYKKLLLYIYETKIHVISPEEIIKENKLSWP